MHISKKLFFIITLNLGLILPINTSEPETEDTNYRNFIEKLYGVSNNTYKENAMWMRAESVKPNNPINDQLKVVVGSNRPLKEKISAIEEIKAQASTQNEGYFSNISTTAKAAIALLVTAGIASYFYFIYPWSSSSK
ncbi:MAG TPA: hypothetical protein VHX42_00735 [Candidatus Babeliales bacterium]|jgi:hypothetical protein|nr:hypothetical protein [Candidatus Babeliales bacterium]